MKKLAIILISLSFLTSCAHWHGKHCGDEKAACASCKDGKTKCESSDPKCADCKDK